MRQLLILFVVLGLVGVTVTSSGAIREASARRSLRHPLAPNAINQHQGHTSAISSQRMTLATDGATAPEAISDELAYAHFLRAMAAIKDPRGRDVALRCRTGRGRRGRICERPPANCRRTRFDKRTTENRDVRRPSRH